MSFIAAFRKEWDARITEAIEYYQDQVEPSPMGPHRRSRVKLVGGLTRGRATPRIARERGGGEEGGMGMVQDRVGRAASTSRVRFPL